VAGYKTNSTTAVVYKTNSTTAVVYKINPSSVEVLLCLNHKINPKNGGFILFKL